MKTFHFKPFGTVALLALLLLIAFGANAGAAQAAPRVGPSAAAGPAPAGTGCSYYVRYGDTLFSIALRFGTTYTQLAMMNSLANPNWIWVGERLNVPCNGQPVPPAPGTPPSICYVYYVQYGDYVKLIAFRFGTTWQAIAHANYLWNPNMIYPGQRLLIPCG